MSTLSGSGSSFLNIAYKDDAKNLQDVLKSKFGDFRVEIFHLITMDTKLHKARNKFKKI